MLFVKRLSWRRKYFSAGLRNVVCLHERSVRFLSNSRFERENICFDDFAVQCFFLFFFWSRKSKESWSLSNSIQTIYESNQVRKGLQGEWAPQYHALGRGLRGARQKNRPARPSFSVYVDFAQFGDGIGSERQLPCDMPRARTFFFSFKMKIEFWN